MNESLKKKKIHNVTFTEKCSIKKRNNQFKKHIYAKLLNNHKNHNILKKTIRKKIELLAEHNNETLTNKKKTLAKSTRIRFGTLFKITKEMKF